MIIKFSLNLIMTSSLIIDVNIADNAPIMFFNAPLAPRSDDQFINNLNQTPHSTYSEYRSDTYEINQSPRWDFSDDSLKENQIVPIDSDHEDHDNEDHEDHDEMFENQLEHLITTGRSYKVDFPHCEFLSTEEHFQILKNCNCCRDHQIDKPTILGEILTSNTKRAFDQKIGGSGRVEDGVCSCDCRHMSRHLSRITM
jgi:hypothetical protein